jgi:hypothetical protein
MRAPKASGIERDPFGHGWQRRLNAEAVQLALKVATLQGMLRRRPPPGHEGQMALMKEQLGHMRAYLDVLHERISDFSAAREERVEEEGAGG